MAVVDCLHLLLLAPEPEGEKDGRTLLGAGVGAGQPEITG